MRKLRGFLIAAATALALLAPQFAKAQDFPSPAGPHRGGVSAGRPDRFRRPPGCRQDDRAVGPARLYRQQAGRQRHAGRRRRRQVRSRRLFAVSHHRGRGDGVAAHHAEHAVRYVPRFRAGRPGHQGHRGAGRVAEARHQDGQGTRRRSPRKSPARFPSHRPASARRRISPRYCSMRRRACNSCTCPIAARRRR